jgi:outer membrane protein
VNWRRPTLLLGLAALLVWATGAQDQAVKIGVVDLDQAINSTEQGKKAREEFARKKRDAESKIQPLLDRYEQMLEELKSKRFVLSDEALFQKQLDMAELSNEIESRRKEILGQLRVDQERLEGPLRNKLVEIVSELGKEQGFTVILARTAPGLMYTREALDITDVVIDRFNKKS